MNDNKIVKPTVTSPLINDDENYIEDDNACIHCCAFFLCFFCLT